MPYYTGVGARNTPDTVLRQMEQIAAHMRERGWRLRSGAAEGADQAFGRGALDRADIYVPWRGFGHAERGARVIALAEDWRLYDEHVRLFQLGCPHFENLEREATADRPATKGGPTKLHARNVLQVVGDTPGEHSSDPSSFLVCWTPDGMLRGGTATAIRIAEHLKVPVFNLGRRDDVLERLANHITALKQVQTRPRPVEQPRGKVLVANMKRLGKPDEILNHYIGRPNHEMHSHLANRWTHRPGTRAEHIVSSRDEAIAAYRKWLWEDNIRPWVYLEDCTPAMDELLVLARECAAGHDQRLVCWCKPEACHGDVIKAAITYLLDEHNVRVHTSAVTS